MEIQRHLLQKIHQLLNQLLLQVSKINPHNISILFHILLYSAPIPSKSSSTTAQPATNTSTTSNNAPPTKANPFLRKLQSQPALASSNEPPKQTPPVETRNEPQPAPNSSAPSSLTTSTPNRSATFSDSSGNQIYKVKYEQEVKKLVSFTKKSIE